MEMRWPRMVSTAVHRRQENSCLRVDFEMKKKMNEMKFYIFGKLIGVDWPKRVIVPQRDNYSKMWRVMKFSIRGND